MMHSRPYFILLISLFLSAITLWCAEAISFNEHITDKIYSWLPFIYFNTNPIPALGFPDVQTLLSSLPIIFTFWIHITLTTFLLIYCLYKPLLENIIKLKYFTALNLVLIILTAILLTNNLSTIYFIVAIIITVNALVRLAIKQDHTTTISLSGACHNFVSTYFIKFTISLSMEEKHRRYNWIFYRHLRAGYHGTYSRCLYYMATEA